jgi:hypothetical protein
MVNRVGMNKETSARGHMPNRKCATGVQRDGRPEVRKTTRMACRAATKTR